MGRALRWTYKLLRGWDQNGFRGMVRVGVDRIIRKGEAQDHDFSRPLYTLRDVLFVNGCPPEQAPHPYRYRVLHQMEQLRAAGYTVDQISAEDCKADSVLSAHIIVFYRCPYSQNIGDAIRQAKALNRRVLFDIDDLVIDTCYTDTIPAVQAMSREDRALYDEGVHRYGATLRMCDGATTTTEALGQELSKYVPAVRINRNTASQRMVQLSEAAWRKAQKEREGSRDEIILGFFSGTLTHNADFEMIKPALLRLMKENNRVKLLLMGEVTLPEELAPFADRIVQKPFGDWETLPEIIAGVDVTLAPLETSVFNAAKSENKWTEAALVKVPTVASRTGAFLEMVRDGETGYLAGDEEWYEVLSRVVGDEAGRRQAGENAYRDCMARCTTLAGAGNLRKIYEELRPPRAAFVLPSSEISGGIMVALRHACFLQDAGWDIDLIMPDLKRPVWTEFGHSFPCVSYKDGAFVNEAAYDLMVATMWTTVDVIRRHPRAGKRAYLVQNYESDFYALDNPERLDCESTYYLPGDWQYLTISAWCAGWLRERYGQQVQVMKNGIQLEQFHPSDRDWSNRKIRLLIEGDCAVDYKNVDESFRIADRLDRDRFEVWYMSYNASPKENYRIDRVLQAVPYDQVHEVYEQCDILLKSSWLESFSYPPLEMMAAGGWAVVAPNGGNAEYLRDEENCLLYPLGDEEAAVRAIERLVQDKALREKLRAGGLRTAAGRDWSDLREDIVRIYQGCR